MFKTQIHLTQIGNMLMPFSILFFFTPSVSHAQSTTPNDMVVVCPAASQPECGCEVFSQILAELRQIKNRLPEVTPTQPTGQPTPIPAPTAVLATTTTTTTETTTTTTTETTTTTTETTTTTAGWSRLSPGNYWHQLRYGW